MALSLALFVASATWAQPTTHAQASPKGIANHNSGDWIAKHIDVRFAPLPSGWKAETNVMDDIWRPLGLRGNNYYAFGGPEPPHSYAARSDPASPWYQAWFGVYAVAGDRTADIATGLKLTDLDQASWLDAMGDAHPLGLGSAAYEKRGSLRIEGADRTLYYIHGRSHSDLSSAATGLARHVGVPPESYWRGGVAPFHDLELRGYMALWHDTKRDLTFVVYAAAPVFRTNDGKAHDDFGGLAAQFLQMMQRVRVVETGVPVR